MDAVGSFFGGQMLHYAGEAGELEAKLKIALKENKLLKAENEARRELALALSAVLERVAPQEQLAQAENQQAIINARWHKELSNN